MATWFFLLAVLSVVGSLGATSDENILGTELEPCCEKCGYWRDGYCKTDASDEGTHVVCAKMTDKFLEFTKSKGNDLITPSPGNQFPGLKEGDSWCLCALRWKEALDESEDVTPNLYLEATNEKVTRFDIEEEVKAHAVGQFPVVLSKADTPPHSIKEFMMYGTFSLNDGGSVPTIAFGTGTTFKGRSDDAAEAVLKGIRAGFRMIDTATAYRTEEGVGLGVKRAIDEGLVTREDVFIMTKLPPYDQSVEKTVEMIAESLKVLQLDYLDCVLIHFPGRPKDFNPQNKSVFFSSITSDPVRAPEARMVMWEALQKCQQEGKVRHIGVSNFNRHHIETLVQDPRCKVKPALNQIEFNPYCCDEDILKSCEEHGIVVQAYSPLGAGVNPGKDGEARSVLKEPVLIEIATRMGCTVGQLCISWALRKHVAVCTKTENESRMTENLESLTFVSALKGEDMEKIGALNINLRKYVKLYGIP